MNPRTIIVTGGAAGIGKAIVERCLLEGHTVIACDIDKDGLKALVKAKATPKLSTAFLDISKSKSVGHFFDGLNKKKILYDVLVNNAGIFLGQNLLAYTDEQIERVLAVNVKGALFMSRRFGKEILECKRNAVIVNISSVAGQAGSGDAVYGATKAALIGLTKSIAIGFAPYIRVNAVAPTLVDTRIMKVVPQDRLKQYKEHELIQETVQPNDVANAVYFLISDESKHFTGATLDINNGYNLR